MCGRFSQFTPPVRLARLFAATVAEGAGEVPRPLFNIGPSATVLGVRTRRWRGDGDGDGDGGPPAVRVLDEFRWGLVPPWSTTLPRSGAMFNARVETVTSRPSFRRAVATQRLVVPADGFFEWRRVDGRRGVPYFFHLPAGEPMALAGLWEVWRDPGDAGRPAGWLRSCTIITTAANEDLAGIHDRMPLVLPPDAVGPWLDPAIAEPEELRSLLVPAPVGTLAHHRVAGAVGDVRVDEARLLDAVPDEPSEQPRLLDALPDQPSDEPPAPSPGSRRRPIR
jgi:putative SOS response-associated peptidase YedK